MIPSADLKKEMPDSRKETANGDDKSTSFRAT